MRKAEVLSTTTAPASTAAGANRRLRLPPAEDSTRSMPSKDSAVSSCTVRLSPRKSMRRPAERLEASSRSSFTGKSRSARISSMTWPTAPVAPMTATL